MNFSDVACLLHTANLSLSEKGIASAKVILTGFVVVFLVLILLIIIIKIYGAIITKIQGGGKKKKKIEKQEPSPVTKTIETAPAPVVQDGVSEEVIAVISAAVAASYGSSAKARIKSIKKSGGGRSAWANAGVLDNTRPF